LQPHGCLAHPAKLNITRKKKVLYANEQQKPEVQQKRLDFAKELTELDPDHLVFVDEGGTTTAMTRPYGRAAKGERVVGSVPGHWESLTLIAGMRLGEVVAPWVIPCATRRWPSAPTWKRFLRRSCSAGTW